MSEATYKFEITPLPYAHDALEPFIDTETMHYHHDKHLQTYIDNLNKALEPYPKLHDRTLEELLRRPSSLPAAARTPIMRNAGGVYNHEFFFKNLRPGQENNAPDGNLLSAIIETFGSFDSFQKKFTDGALAVFGSGYMWLVRDKRRKLLLISGANQESPITYNCTPITTIDVWEHAYYLKHQNRRNDYVEDWWHVVNWQQAGINYDMS